MKTILGNDVYKVWAQGTQDKGYNRSYASVFFEGDTIYSYGHHFPLAIRMNQGMWYLVNADTYSSTTNGHQAAVRSVVHETGCPSMLIPFTALRQVSRDFGNIVLLDVEPERTFPYGKRHLLGQALFKTVVKNPNNDTDQERYFVSGIDESARALKHGYFLTELVRPATTVADAIASLKPAAVVEAEKVGVKVLRQGEWFFIPVSGRLVGAKPVTYDPKVFYAPLPDRHLRSSRVNVENRHVVTELKEKDGVRYARGTVKHIWREHKPVRLVGWHQVYENVQVQSFAAGGRVD